MHLPPSSLALGSRGRAALLTTLALVGASAAAPAEVASPPCRVDVAAAPDDARAAIARWLAGEPSCAHALMVRVERVDSGLQVTAVDERQQVYTRVVADADSVGVLVASWAAAPAPVPAAASSTGPSGMPSVGAAPPPGAPADRAVEAAPRRWPWLRLTAAGTVDQHGRFGVEARGVATLLRRGVWSVDAVGRGFLIHDDYWEVWSGGLTGSLAGAGAVRRGPWTGRAAIEVGGGRYHRFDDSLPDQSSNLWQVGVDLSLARALRSGWEVEGGLNLRTARFNLFDAIHDATNVKDEARLILFRLGVAAAL